MGDQNPGLVIPNFLSTNSRERMSLEQARRTLQEVVSTPEVLVTPQTPLSGVREAAIVVAEDLFTTYPFRTPKTKVELRGWDDGLDEYRKQGRKISKYTPQGKVAFDFDVLQPSDEVVNSLPLPSIGLWLYERPHFAGGITVTFPLGAISDEFARQFIYYSDCREEVYPNDYASLRPHSDLHWDGITRITLDGYRKLFRGVRWMFANMLTWDRLDVILPEQLDRLALTG